MSKSAKAVSTASFACPVTTTTGRAREAPAARAAQRTKGSPRKSATSLVSSVPPAARYREALPAARTIAAMLAIGLARLRPALDFHQKSADAHALDVGAGDGNVGEQTAEHPI